MLKVNLGYVISYVLCNGIGVFYSSFSLAGNAQTTTIFEAKFGWSKDETILYNTIITSSAIVGLLIGSLLGGYLIKHGRRKGAILANIIGIVGAVITMVATIPFLTFGRLLVGVAAGVYNVIFPKMIVENMPVQLSQRLAMCHSASIQVGLVVAYGLGGILPDPKDAEASKQDELWRFIFLVPAFIGTFELILTLLVFRQEPIAYCIMMGYEE